MRIPRWKKWLSYVREIPIETLDSEFNGTLEVLMTKGRYQLCTPNAIYSFDDKYDNFVKGFEKIDWVRFKPKNALILGLGLGSIPYILEHTLQKKLSYTAVEIDESVVDLVSTYTLPRLKSPIEIVCADAFVYAQTCAEKYDLVLLDIFISDKIPKKFETTRYYEMMEDLIAPEGLLLVNKLAMTEKDRNAAAKNFKVFQQTFPNSVSLDVDNNYIFFHDSSYLKG